MRVGLNLLFLVPGDTGGSETYARQLVPALAAAGAATAGVVAAASGRSVFETASFAALAPLYAVAHGAGMWRGLGMLARNGPA